MAPNLLHRNPSGQRCEQGDLFRSCGHIASPPSLVRLGSSDQYKWQSFLTTPSPIFHWIEKTNCKMRVRMILMIIHSILKSGSRK